MPSVVPNGARDSRPLEVSKDALKAWTDAGYVEVGGSSSPAKKTAKKSTAKKSSSRKSS